jgi:hypothetical protein
LISLHSPYGLNKKLIDHLALVQCGRRDGENPARIRLSASISMSYGGRQNRQFGKTFFRDNRMSACGQSLWLILPDIETNRGRGPRGRDVHIYITTFPMPPRDQYSPKRRFRRVLFFLSFL